MSKNPENNRVKEQNHGHVNTYELSSGEAAYIAQVANELPALRTEDNALASDVLADYRTAFDHPAVAMLKMRLTESLRTDVSANGYLLMRGLPIDMTNEPEKGELITTALASSLATPVKVYQKWPLHKPLGVNPNIDPMRATGTGINPLHIDMVNTTKPPQFVTFVGVRKDPAGGGFSTASHFPSAIDALTDEEKELLAQPVFEEGQFFDLTQVGEEYKPFPVLTMTDEGYWHARYSGKGMAINSAGSSKTAQALERFGEILEGNASRFLLDANDVAIFNQRISAHGREALGEDYARFEEQRLITQLFLQAD